MLNHLKEELKDHIEKTFQKAYPKQKDFPVVDIEVPADKTHGEFSTNIAMKSAKVFQKSPLAIAEEFMGKIDESLKDSPLMEKIDKIEVKKPGFINFYLKPAALQTILAEVFEKEAEYGASQLGAGKKIQIEFVSANPTGPLSIAHARQAAVGDVLGNVLSKLGFAVEKEYYVNDGGNQIKLLGQSLQIRALEHFDESVEFPEDGYQGDYIQEMAQVFMKQNKIKTLDDLKKTDEVAFSTFGCDFLLEAIKKDLEDFNVHFDVWTAESSIATQAKIEEILDYLGEKGFLYEKDGALWFKTTDFGDDKDRVVEKSDGTYTYLTPDIVYHKNKYDRGFDQVINIWGPDHHGYISRIKAAAEALGKDRDALQVLIVQLASITRDGKAVSMSTRKGQYISLREVLDEVGADAARFFFLMRHISAHLDFDLELAKKQSPENPVYYIQYAYARVFSINAKAKEEGIPFNLNNFSMLTQEEEIDLIKKIGSFGEALIYCHQQLDPYPLISYMQELATDFHKFYDCHKVVGDDRQLSEQRLALCQAARIVLANGLALLGVSAPESM